MRSRRAALVAGDGRAAAGSPDGDAVARGAGDVQGVGGRRPRRVECQRQQPGGRRRLVVALGQRAARVAGEVVTGGDDVAAGPNAGGTTTGAADNGRRQRRRRRAARGRGVDAASAQARGVAGERAIRDSRPHRAAAAGQVQPAASAGHVARQRGVEDSQAGDALACGDGVDATAGEGGEVVPHGRAGERHPRCARALSRCGDCSTLVGDVAAEGRVADVDR